MFSTLQSRHVRRLPCVVPMDSTRSQQGLKPTLGVPVAFSELDMGCNRLLPTIVFELCRKQHFSFGNDKLGDSGSIRSQRNQAPALQSLRQCFGKRIKTVAVRFGRPILRLNVVNLPRVYTWIRRFRANGTRSAFVTLES